MSKKRGLSADDKRSIIQKVYHDKKEPLNLKEIENYASKLGVVQQTVKDMNQSLVDDFLVMSDKIGSANFYWSFPSKAYQDRIVVRDNHKQHIAHLEAQIAMDTLTIEQLRSTRKSEGRSVKIQELRALQEEEGRLDVNLKANAENDPEELRRLESELQVLCDGVNRWTENTFTLKHHLKKKHGMSSKEADQKLQIGADFEELDVAAVKKSIAAAADKLGKLKK